MSALIEQLVDDIDIKMTKYVLIKIEYNKDILNSNENFALNVQYIKTFLSYHKGVDAIYEQIKELLLYYQFCNLTPSELSDDKLKDYETICKYLNFGQIEIHEGNKTFEIGTYNCNGYGTRDTLNHTPLGDITIDTLEYDFDNDDQSFRIRFSTDRDIIEFRLLEICA